VSLPSYRLPSFVGSFGRDATVRRHAYTPPMYPFTVFQFSEHRRDRRVDVSSRLGVHRFAPASSTNGESLIGEIDRRVSTPTS